MRIFTEMKTSKINYIAVLMLMLTGVALGQETGSDIRREVKLYNPFKPTLTRETKVSFLPDMKDTSAVNPLFEYRIFPKAFVPEIELKTIGAAKLEPDPLPKLYNSFINIGFGNYFSPVVELSISSKRSRNRILGFYANHASSFGNLTLGNDESVYGGYMDTDISLYGTRFFTRSALSGSIDFNHLRRFAYGYDPAAGPLPETGKDSLRIDYMMPGAEVSYFSTRLDSTHLYYDGKIFYNLLYQTKDVYSHNFGAEFNGGYDLKIFYAKAKIRYENYNYSDFIDFKSRNLISFDPSINRTSGLWAFRIGFSMITDSRNEYDPAGLLAPEYKTKLYLYPDMMFRFSIIPSFMSLYVKLDGEFENNQAADIVSYNPFVVVEDSDGQIMPSADLYMLRPTDHKLRIGGGLLGSAGDFTTYKLTVSYSMFEDMLFFMNDLNYGRGFIPLYDGGELLTVHGDIGARINDEMSLSASAEFYNYKLETADHPWHKPGWEGKLTYAYNLRNKIVATATVNGISKRYAMFGPMPYSGETDPTINEMPVHFSLDIGAEYRYTKILSFWTRLNNISNNRYYAWNFYPSQRFILMAGFTYSL